MPILCLYLFALKDVHIQRWPIFVKTVINGHAHITRAGSLGYMKTELHVGPMCLRVPSCFVCPFALLPLE